MGDKPRKGENPPEKIKAATIHCSWCSNEIKLSQVSNCPHCARLGQDWNKGE